MLVHSSSYFRCNFSKIKLCQKYPSAEALSCDERDWSLQQEPEEAVEPKKYSKLEEREEKHRKEPVYYWYNLIAGQ